MGAPSLQSHIRDGVGRAGAEHGPAGNAEKEGPRGPQRVADQSV